MKVSTKIRALIFCLATVLGLAPMVPAEDRPVKIRRTPVVVDSVEFKSAPRAVPVSNKAPATPAAAKNGEKASSAAAERPPIPEVVVRKAKAVDGGPASPKEKVEEAVAPKDVAGEKEKPAAGEKVSAQEVGIRELEEVRARTMQPAVPAPKMKKKSAGRVSWTERYELGPGDQLNFGLHGQPKLVKLKVPVAPDWTISYLQAKQISVRGRTVEELRVEMERVLSSYHRNPKVKVSPALLGSKKYTVLGKVKSNDTYKLDRPTTLLEAIAKAKGIVVGVRNANAVELADLKRSFVVRDGKKLPVDMEKLYRTGDMKQNVLIEPGDYIYIASNVHNESYVFGSVVRPGTVPLAGNLTVMGAIAESGSYAKYAWKKRVLLIRGSVGSPEPVVIDTREVLRGNQKDVLLEPGDIVYVHKRPWSYAEEIVDVAIKAYIQSATAVVIQGEDSVSIGL